MGKRVFVSYCHAQGRWVWERLVPVLKAGGAEVLMDRERFGAGRSVAGQMDATQDAADLSVLVLSPQYLASEACKHEMNRAIDRDPRFAAGRVVPLMLVDCTLPVRIGKPKSAKPLYVDLRDDKTADSRDNKAAVQWDLLLKACDAPLGVTAPDWLKARDDLRRYLERDQSVSFVVDGDPRWRELIEHLRRDYVTDLGIVDLHDPATGSRRGLVERMLRALGSTVPVPPEHEDLVVLGRELSARIRSRLALLHFDEVTRAQYNHPDLFHALRYHMMDTRKLTLLAQSRRPFAALRPDDASLSKITIPTVELRGRP